MLFDMFTLAIFGSALWTGTKVGIIGAVIGLLVGSVIGGVFYLSVPILVISVPKRLGLSEAIPKEPFKFFVAWVLAFIYFMWFVLCIFGAIWFTKILLEIV